MIDKIALIVRNSIKVVMRLLFVFPIKKNTVLIDSMFGKGISDNAKYYINYINSIDDKNIRYVWGLVNPKGQPAVNNVRFIRYKSVLWFYYRATAKVILYSHHLYNYLPIRKGQYNVLMWHAGGAYKRIGINVAANTTKEIELHRYRNRYINAPQNIFISSSDYFTKYNIEEVYSFKGRIEKTGMPRNDVFFDEAKVKEISKRIKEKYQTGEHPVILFAPTFHRDRARTAATLNGMDFDRIINAGEHRFGIKPVILYRCHYYDQSEIRDSRQVINVSDYPDMQELLCSADILITDYSSCIWDYALRGKPSFLYTPDLQTYTNDEQGFFTPIETWPGLVCEDIKSLCESIENVDDEFFRQKAKEHLDSFGSYENGKASAALHSLVKELIIQEGT